MTIVVDSEALGAPKCVAYPEIKCCFTLVETQSARKSAGHDEIVDARYRRILTDLEMHFIVENSNL